MNVKRIKDRKRKQPTMEDPMQSLQSLLDGYHLDCDAPHYDERLDNANCFACDAQEIGHSRFDVQNFTYWYFNVRRQDLCI